MTHRNLQTRPYSGSTTISRNLALSCPTCDSAASARDVLPRLVDVLPQTQLAVWLQLPAAELELTHRAPAISPRIESVDSLPSI